MPLILSGADVVAMARTGSELIWTGYLRLLNPHNLHHTILSPKSQAHPHLQHPSSRLKQCYFLSLMPPIGTATTAATRAGSPSRSSVPHRHSSPLNPHSRPATLKTTPISVAATSTTISTKTHLSNLDRVLIKQPSSELPQVTHGVGRDRGTFDTDHLGHTATAVGGGGFGLLNALNLPFHFPFLRKPVGEEMSPWSLTHLQRLLSNPPRSSPKSSIASRWRLYHGAKDWSGLLDPLDENLRRELLRYGDFVQAAYHAFHSRPAASSPACHVHLPSSTVPTGPPSPSSLPPLSASPPWANSSAPAWLTQRSRWIGYVAV